MKTIIIQVIPAITDAYLKLLYSEINKIDGIKILGYENYIKAIKNIFKVDIYHLHWIEGLFKGFSHYNILTVIIRSLFYILILLFLKLLKKKIVITLHNVHPHKIEYPLIENILFNFSLKIADSIIVHNEYSKSKAIELYAFNENKISIIPIGNYNKYYKNNITKCSARKSLGISDDKFVILFFGTIRTNKGINDLLIAFEELLNEKDDLYIIIAGYCIDKKIISILDEFSSKYKHASHIKIEYIDDDDVQIYMNAADVGILPYQNISTSGVLLLFMSFRKVVIVSDLKPIREILGNDGIFFIPKDIDSLKIAISETKSGKYDLKEYSSNAYEKSKLYTWDKIAEQTSNLYKSLIR